MKVLVSEKLSEHKYKTPEGYLICTDAILARTGKQTYTKDELFGDSDETEVDVDRPYNEVMNPKTIASFENKPVTFDHPNEDVNVGNYKDYAIGYVRDVHQGKTDKGEDVILGNLVITDQDAINAIEQGDHTDLSCGYDCDIKDDNKGAYMQTNIRGNHVALCEQGRAGIARIVDSKARDSKIEGVSPELLLSASEWFEDKIYIERNYHVKIYNITSNKGLTVTGSRQDLEKLYKDYHLKDYYGLKIVDSKVEDDEYTYKLTKKKNDYDEYVIQAYKNGKKNEDATYYTDDWDDAINTLKSIAKQEKLTFRQQGSIFIADNKAKAFNDSKEMTMSDALRMLNIVKTVSK